MVYNVTVINHFFVISEIKVMKAKTDKISKS